MPDIKNPESFYITWCSYGLMIEIPYLKREREDLCLLDNFIVNLLGLQKTNVILFKYCQRGVLLCSEQLCTR